MLIVTFIFYTNDAKTMNKQIITTLFLLLLSYGFGFAQYVERAVLFNQTLSGGTARTQAIGAQASLGGDIGLVPFNPAGLGFFNQSELTVSPSLQVSSAKADYLGQTTQDARARGGIDNFGVVFNLNRNKEVPSPWRSSFAVSYSKANSYYRDYTYDGANTNSDLIDHIVNEANLDRDANLEPSSLTILAFDNYLIENFFDTAPSGDTIVFDGRNQDLGVPGNDYPVRQVDSYTVSGSQSRWNFAYGGNFKDQVYLGVSINIMGVDNVVSREYQEEPTGSAILNRYTLTERRRTQGTGINATLGAIYRPITPVTVGLSYTTPTIYSLSEVYRIGIRSSWNNYTFPPTGDVLNEVDPLPFEGDPFNFTLRTPQRVRGGLSYFFEKYGFISASAEWLNYEGNRFTADRNELGVDNETVGNILGNVINFNVGGEFRYQTFRVRGGYGLLGNPYTNGENGGSSRISGGVGLRFSNYFVDLTVVNTQFAGQASPYIFSESAYVTDGELATPVAKIENSITNVVFTLGFNF